MRKVFLITLTLFIGFMFQGCASTYYLDTQGIKSAVSGYDNQYTDVLTLHCRVSMDMVVAFQKNTLECKAGEVLSLTYKHSPIYSSRNYYSISVPVLIYPKDKENSDIEGISRTWRVSRTSDSDQSWLIELSTSTYSTVRKLKIKTAGGW